MGEIITIAAAGIVVTKIVDTVRNGLDRGDTAPKMVWNVLAFVLGIAGAFLYNVEDVTGLGGPLGQVGSGLVIGATASGWHEILDAFSAHGSRGGPK
jgi:hypothetical protein